MASRGHHHMHGKHNSVHHHYKRGGASIPEEHGGKMHDYTADSEVVKEAEGEERHRGGRMKKADGGATKLRRGGHVAEEKMEEEHEKRANGGAAPAPAAFKRGGHVKHVDGEGHKGHRRMDRPGRKRGGGVGADMKPLSTAATTRQGGAHSADNDELSV